MEITKGSGVEWEKNFCSVKVRKNDSQRIFDLGCQEYDTVNGKIAVCFDSSTAFLIYEEDDDEVWSASEIIAERKDKEGSLHGVIFNNLDQYLHICTVIDDSAAGDAKYSKVNTDVLNQFGLNTPEIIADIKKRLDSLSSSRVDS